MTVLAAYLAGVETVRGAVEHPVIGKLMRNAAFNEIARTMKIDESEKRAYIEAILERFKNPFIKHYCMSIALNSVSKFKVRVLPSLVQFVAKEKAVPQILSFSLAALIVFYRVRETAGTQYFCVRADDGMRYEIKDDASALDFFRTVWDEYNKNNDTLQLAKKVLSNETFWLKKSLRTKRTCRTCCFLC